MFLLHPSVPKNQWRLCFKLHLFSNNQKFHEINITQFVYLFWREWIFGLFSGFRYLKQHCSQHSYTCILGKSFSERGWNCSVTKFVHLKLTRQYQTAFQKWFRQFITLPPVYVCSCSTSPSMLNIIQCF